MEDAEFDRTGDIEVERLLELRIGARSVRRRNVRPHGDELRVDGVVDEEIDTVLAEGGAGVVGPAVEQRVCALQVRQLPTQTEGDAPVLHVAAEARCEPAREPFVEAEAIRIPVQSALVISGVVGRDSRAVAGHSIVGQVGDQ